MKILARSIIILMALGISLLGRAATFTNQYTGNPFGTAIPIYVGTNQIQLGSNAIQFVFIVDSSRITNFPVALFRPTPTNTSMIFDLMPSSVNNSFTSINTPFLVGIDIVNRDLDHVLDNTNFVAGRFALRPDSLILGTSAGGISNAYPVIFQAGTNFPRPFSFVWQGQGGATLVTNAWLNYDGSLFLSNGLQGTVSGSSAPSGIVGEFVSVTNSFATGTNMTSTLDTNALKLTLTAGDWLVFGHATFASSSSSAKVTQLKASIGLVNQTVNSDGTQVYNWPNVTNNAFTASVSISTPVRVNVTGSTTVFLNANSTFSSGPVVVYGEMEATRIR